VGVQIGVMRVTLPLDSCARSKGGSAGAEKRAARRSATIRLTGRRDRHAEGAAYLPELMLRAMRVEGGAAGPGQICG